MIAPIFAFNSSDVPKYNYDHTVELTKIKDSEYLLSYTVSEEFLTSPSTVYPVTIDPSVSFNIPNDAPVYSKYPNANYQSNPTGCVGYSSSWGTGRLYLSVDLSSLGDIKPEEIYYAQLSLRETTGATTAAQVYVYEATSSWSASSITYGNQPYLSTTEVNSFNANSANEVYWYYIDITESIKNWERYENNYGLVLKAATDSTAYWRAFAKSNYSQTNLRPYLTIYTDARDVRSWGTIGSNGARGGVVAGSNIHITFTVPTSGVYYIETAQPNIPDGVLRDTRLYLYNSSGMLLDYNDDISGSYLYSRIVRTLAAGTYTIWLVEYGSPDNIIDYVASYITIWAEGALIAINTSFPSYSQNYANAVMDFIKLGDGGDYSENGSYNCLAYALDKNATEEEWPWLGKPTPAQSKAYLEEKGYIVSSSPTNNCIVEYIKDGRITHYARIDNGIVTAKLGEWERVQHNTYNPYFYQSYGESYRFYVK